VIQFYSMLTIINIENLYKKDVGEWRVRAIETLDSAYLIHLLKPNLEMMQINLERNAIGEGDSALYELWFWSDGTPIRQLLSKRDLRLGIVPLIELIKHMLKSLK
jgi:hypothetical protein